MHRRLFWKNNDHESSDSEDSSMHKKSQNLYHGRFQRFLSNDGYNYLKNKHKENETGSDTPDRKGKRIEDEPTFMDEASKKEHLKSLKNSQNRAIDYQNIADKHLVKISEFLKGESKIEVLASKGDGSQKKKDAVEKWQEAIQQYQQLTAKWSKIEQKIKESNHEQELRDLFNKALLQPKRKKIQELARNSEESLKDYKDELISSIRDADVNLRRVKNEQKTINKIKQNIKDGKVRSLEPLSTEPNSRPRLVTELRQKPLLEVWKQAINEYIRLRKETNDNRKMLKDNEEFLTEEKL